MERTMMLEKMREATNSLHNEVEKDNLAQLIINHKISLEEYKLLLYQNFVAYKITEEEIARHLEDFKGAKHKQIDRDLEYLNINTSLAYLEDNLFTCKNRAEALGAAYVVEGSALGGMMISKEILNCNSLNEIKIHHFFSGDRQNIKDWRNFTKVLKNQEFTLAEEDEAINKAKETFKFFGYVFSSVALPQK